MPSDHATVEVPDVVLSAFADEAAPHKTLLEQFSSLAAIGLSYYSVRFLDLGTGIKNVMELSTEEVQQVQDRQQEFGMRVASLGSPIGKVKLLDVDDGTSNRFVAFDEYLARDVWRACELAVALETKLLRGFSFYPPKQDDPAQHLAATVERLGRIAETCQRHELIFGLEVEANLVGRTGDLLLEIWQQVNHPSLVLIFDAANLLSQGFTPEETYRQYEVMKPGMGWLHVKDYKPLDTGAQDYVDEEQLSDFVSVDRGSGVYDRVFLDLRETPPPLLAALRAQGVPGLIVDLEPHLKGGGQFGGFSGPDGMGVAARALCEMLDDVGLSYRLRSFQDTQGGGVAS